MFRIITDKPHAACLLLLGRKAPIFPLSLETEPACVWRVTHLRNMTNEVEIMPHYTKMQAYVLDFCLWCVWSRVNQGTSPLPVKKWPSCLKAQLLLRGASYFLTQLLGFNFAGPFHFLSWGFYFALVELQLVLLVAAGSPLVLIWYSSAHRYESCCQDAILPHVLMFVPLLSPPHSPPVSWNLLL